MEKDQVIAQDILKQMCTAMIAVSAYSYPRPAEGVRPDEEVHGRFYMTRFIDNTSTYSIKSCGSDYRGIWIRIPYNLKAARIVALKSIYPPCRQCLPHQAWSNQDEIWGRASSQGQQLEAGRV